LTDLLASLAVRASPDDKGTYEVDVRGSQQWTDSRMDVAAGDRLLVTASGSLRYSDAKPTGPDGLPRGWKDLLRLLPLNEAGRGALIGRIGQQDAAQPFLIGSRAEIHATSTGRLYLGVNQPGNESAQGSFRAKIQILERASRTAKTSAAPGAAKDLGSVPEMAFPRDALEKIPRRVGDSAGTPGDMVNFLILGSEEMMQQAFRAAGWVRVDRTNEQAVLHGLLASLSKQAYVELPMSELYLFGRPQDFGYAHAEPLAVALTRHHLRLWKAPFEVAGQAVWVGAATHDVGLERDKRNGKLTHKIDPAVDQEREFVGGSLSQTGLVAGQKYVTASNPVTEALTATGGSFHSDGRTLVLWLKPAEKDRSAAFADLFCSVLGQEAPDGGRWGDCSQYLETPSTQRVALAPIPAKYRLLIVPGVLSSCTASTPAFQEGQAHLREKHGMTVDLLPVPNDSSEANAGRIADYLRQQRKRGDSRKFIVLGYSKGAPDLQVALAEDAEAASAVAAFITVAGAVGGSPIADLLPAQAENWIRALHLGECEGDLSAAFGSLRSEVRKAFLAHYPSPAVPTYSLAAVSESNNTSKLLGESWQMLAVYDPKQDSTVVKADTIVPGAFYLGTALADHVAVAIPLETSSDATVRSAADHNHYPRAALLEALVRFALTDLEAAK